MTISFFTPVAFIHPKPSFCEDLLQKIDGYLSPCPCQKAYVISPGSVVLMEEPPTYLKTALKVASYCILIICAPAALIIALTLKGILRYSYTFKEVSTTIIPKTALLEFARATTYNIPIIFPKNLGFSVITQTFTGNLNFIQNHFDNIHHNVPSRITLPKAEQFVVNATPVIVREIVPPSNLDQEQIHRNNPLDVETVKQLSLFLQRSYLSPVSWETLPIINGAVAPRLDLMNPNPHKLNWCLFGMSTQEKYLTFGQSEALRKKNAGLVGCLFTEEQFNALKETLPDDLHEEFERVKALRLNVLKCDEAERTFHTNKPSPAVSLPDDLNAFITLLSEDVKHTYTRDFLKESTTKLVAAFGEVSPDPTDKHRTVFLQKSQIPWQPLACAILEGLKTAGKIFGYRVSSSDSNHVHGFLVQV